ncbi:JAB domain-containing protein [Chitinophaga filiformis]|uniref:MPN domain-containing protein n=1 Tax=Chitinophaga filiformis TaxID=104663 RepID=A0ABY4HW24_CHIFI|nr:JAB domain-containing protein [Chitinophaga filiformis]UPK67984.1 hypothetical protein MYF79_23815 [Chitinophaga filiformis]
MKTKNCCHPSSHFNIPQVKLSYKTKVNISERPFIRGSLSAGKFLLSTWDKNTLELQETCRVMLLSHSHRILGIYDSTIGNGASCIIDIRHIFATALLANAAAIIVAHNHPSGNLKPSRADEAICNKLIKAGRYLDIAVLDFIIITRGKFLSFADNKLMESVQIYDSVLDEQEEQISRDCIESQSGLPDLEDTSKVTKHLHELATSVKQIPHLLKASPRSLKVEPHNRRSRSKCTFRPPPGRTTSKIRLTGNWLQKSGFHCNSRVSVLPMERMLIVIPE